MVADKSITRRRYLWKRGKRRCTYCDVHLTWSRGRYMLTADHKTPLCRGGKNARDNLVAACFECNVAKGPLTAQEFYALRRDPQKLRAMVDAIIAKLPKKTGRGEREKSWFIGDHGIEFYEDARS